MAKNVKDSPATKSNTISTNVMLKNHVRRRLIREAQRQGGNGQGNIAVSKLRARLARGLKARKTKAHPLYRRLSGQLHETQTLLQQKCSGDVESAKIAILEHLDHSMTGSDKQGHRLGASIKALSEPLDTQMLEWLEGEKQHSGITDLARVMKTLNKEVIVAEKDFIQYQAERARIDAALHNRVASMTEPKDIPASQAASRLSPDHGYREISKNLGAEVQKVTVLIEQEKAATIKALSDVDQVSEQPQTPVEPSLNDQWQRFLNRLQQLDTVHQGVLALLEDDQD